MDRKEGERKAISAAKWDIGLRLGLWIGAIAGFLVGVWLILSTGEGWSIVAPFVLAAAGGWIGWRLVLALWAK